MADTLLFWAAYIAAFVGLKSVRPLAGKLALAAFVTVIIVAIVLAHTVLSQPYND
jgi:hypothetical protein